MNTLILLGIGIAAALHAISEYRRESTSTITSRVWARILIAAGALVLAGSTADMLPRSQQTLLTILGSCFMASGLLQLIDLRPRQRKEP